MTTDTDSEQEDFGDSLEESVTILINEVKTLREEVNTLQSETQALKAQNEELQDRITHLEDRVDILKNRLDQHDAKFSHHLEDLVAHETQLDELEQQLMDQSLVNPDDSLPANTLDQVIDGEITPLVRACAYDESTAEEHLTKNQRAARLLAQNLDVYTDRVPNGYALPSQVVRRAIKSSTGETPHTQTVTRVIEFLDDLGKDDVVVKVTNGTKKVVFRDQETVEKYQQASQLELDLHHAVCDGVVG